MGRRRAGSSASGSSRSRSRSRSRSGDKETVVRELDIPRKKWPLCIGRNGGTVRSITERFHVQMDVPDSRRAPPPGKATVTWVTLRGTDRDCEDARAELERIPMMGAVNYREGDDGTPGSPRRRDSPRRTPPPPRRRSPPPPARDRPRAATKTETHHSFNSPGRLKRSRELPPTSYHSDSQDGDSYDQPRRRKAIRAPPQADELQPSRKRRRTGGGDPLFDIPLAGLVSAAQAAGVDVNRCFTRADAAGMLGDAVADGAVERLPLRALMDVARHLCIDQDQCYERRDALAAVEEMFDAPPRRPAAAPRRRGGGGRRTTRLDSPSSSSSDSEPRRRPKRTGL